MQLIALYVSGTINTVLSEHHRREMRHYLYAHQVGAPIPVCFNEVHGALKLLGGVDNRFENCSWTELLDRC